MVTKELLSEKDNYVVFEDLRRGGYNPEEVRKTKQIKISKTERVHNREVLCKRCEGDDMKKSTNNLGQDTLKKVRRWMMTILTI